MSDKRGKNIIQKPLTLKHSYQFYIKDIQPESKYNIDYKLYRAICEDANKMLMSKITEDGWFFKMPYRLGIIRVKKRKVDLRNLKPDFGLFNKSEEEYKNKHLNEHTGNYYVKFHWNKKLATIIKNKTAYSFTPTRFHKRSLAALLKREGMLQINKYFD